MKKLPRIAVHGLFLAITVMAAIFTPFLVFMGVIICSFIAIDALEPFSSQGRAIELAATVIWLYEAILVFSNVIVDRLSFVVFAIVGGVLATSRVHRESTRSEASGSLIQSSPLVSYETVRARRM